MKTDDLINALGADAGRPALSLGGIWMIAALSAVIIAGLVFMAALGPRPDIAAAAGTVRFPFKFVVTGLLAGTALVALLALSRPETVSRTRLAALAAAPLALAIAVGLELAAVPEAEWMTRLVGTNMMDCLAAIPSIGLGPLALFTLALRNAAPSRPLLAGAVAGLAAGGIAATFYASHCTDDSPLFVATWYTVAVAVLTIAGAVAGRTFARW